MKIVFSEKCLGYSWPGHIESPDRIRNALKLVKKTYKFLEPEPASVKDLLRVHSKEYVDMIKNAEAGSYLDGDTPVPNNIYEYARLSVGGAILAAATKGFSLMRPPGHHAGRSGSALSARTLGFCYFNSIAIATRKLDLPTLILDIDGHHGNGTQEIFLKDPKVTYISLHRYPHYPGTGLRSQDNCLNFPLPYSAGDSVYLKTLDAALKQVNMENIEIVGISAGFDAHQGDLASLGLSSNCYREIGKKIGALRKPAFAILEGGYIGENIGRDLHQLIQGLEER